MRFLGNKCIEVWSIEDVEFAAYSIDEPVSKQEAKNGSHVHGAIFRLIQRRQLGIH